MKNPFHKLKNHFSTPDREQSFLEHLEDFRRMLIRCIVSLTLVTAACIPLAKPMLYWLQEPLLRVAKQQNYTFELITTSPVEGFMQIVKVIFAAGVLLSLPIMLYFIAQFILPGLMPREKKMLVYGGLAGALLFIGGGALGYFIAQFILPGLMPREKKMLVYGGLAGALLFIGGVALGYFISLPVAISIMFYFNDYLGTVANWKMDAYLGFVMQLLIGFGLAFELPLLLLFLGFLGIVSVEQLTTYRRHVG
ncbi:MAG: preprotein translocase subunit TatC, partial [Kiritimatiellaceae bacterium]|nr:preprotein translocase subunit TatC [Kiritimatiellaceae bacterium]